MSWYLIGSDCGGEHRTPFDLDARLRKLRTRKAEVVEDDAERDADVNEGQDNPETEDEK